MGDRLLKWYKHDSDANMDARLQEVLLDYGLEGYGLYWYCLELITNKVTSDNITFTLEHDARVIARNTGSTVQKVEEMMKKFVSLGLFEEDGGIITCFKLAKRLDQSMTNSPKMRVFIDSIRKKQNVMTSSTNVMKEEEGEEEQIKTINTPAKPKYEECDMSFAQSAFIEIQKTNPAHKEPNFNTWATDVRKMRTIDKRDLNEMARVWMWVRQDSFWSTNILSISKFREKYDQLVIKMKMNEGTKNESNGRPTTTRSDNSAAGRVRQNGAKRKAEIAEALAEIERNDRPMANDGEPIRPQMGQLIR
jgi:hypothetical protein